MNQEYPSINPTLKAERVGLLDALRGFAIFGIFYAHLYEWTNYNFLDEVEQETAVTAWLDYFADYLHLIFIDSKFRSIFAFLFGFSFVLQVQRSEGKSISFVKHYVRRMSSLLLFALVHIFIFEGEILTVYAVTGFVLLAFRKRSDRCILLWAIGLTLWPILCYGFILKLNGAYNLSACFYNAAEIRNPDGLPYRGFGGYLYQFDEGFIGAVQYKTSVLLATLGDHVYDNQIPKILGMFLFGMWAGRRGILTDLAANLSILKKTLVIGGIVGLVAGSIRAYFIWEIADTFPLSEIGWWVTVLYAISIAPFAMAYISGFALLWQSKAWQTKLNLFAPIGRMALTNYLMHSVIGFFIYFAVVFGWLFQPTPIWFFFIATIVFGIQLGCSHWWLARFRYGPMEWVWRMLTYGLFLPLRLSSQGISSSPK